MAMTLGVLGLAPRATSLAALTTTFTPDETCTQHIYQVLDPTAECVAGTVPVACNYLHLGPTTPASACVPSGYDPSTTAFFSPGLACPVGYTTACSTTVTLTGGVEEVHATCCPLGSYTCQTNTGWDWYSTDACFWHIPTVVEYTFTSTPVGGDPVTLTATGNGQAEVNAYAFVLAYQASDLLSSTTTSTTMTTATTSTSSSSTKTSSDVGPTVTVTDAPKDNGGGGGGGLSSGAQIGIGVGVGVVLLLAIAAMAFFFLNRRRRARAIGPSAYGAQPESKVSGSSPAYPSAPTNQPPQEMPSHTHMAELDGASRG